MTEPSAVPEGIPALPTDRLCELLEDAAALLDRGAAAETETLRAVYRDVLHEARHRLAASDTLQLENESRSPDGDGRPMGKGLGDRRADRRVSSTETGEGIPAIGRRTGASGLAGGFDVHQKPAAGSEPADSHPLNISDQIALIRRWLAGDRGVSVDTTAAFHLLLTALDNRAASDTPPSDPVCEHGVAMDVHCCGCHSGFLFDPERCTCLHPLLPDYWRCRTCGCLWRDNHDDTVSLASAKQTSCIECEQKGSAEACEPLWLAAQAPPGATPSGPHD